MSLLDKLLTRFDKRADLEEKITSNGVVPLEAQGEQTTDENNLATFVRSKIEDIRMNGSRVAHEAQWMTNIAYVLGYAFVSYDAGSRSFRRSGGVNNIALRNRVFVNKMLPTLQRRLSRLCKNPPRYEVRPDSGDQEAKDRARLEQQVLEMYWDKERINEKRIAMTMGVQQCGHYYFRVLYDTEKGELLEGYNDNGDMEYIREGDVAVEVVSAFEVFPDPLARSIDDCAYLIHAKVRRLDYFRTHYPERGHLVKEEDTWLLSAQYEMRINAITGLGPSASGISLQSQNSALEMSYYEKPSSLHPKGRLVVVANGVLLADRDLPVGEIPFAKFDDVVVAGKYYPEAVATHLRPIQDQYNRTITIRAKWVNRSVFGKFLAAKNHGVMAEGFNDQSAEIIEYNPVPGASEPKALDVPMIPQFMYNETTELERQFYDIAGEGDVSRGVLPSSSIPAIGMQLLLEQDESRLAVETEQHEHAYARLGRLILMYAEKFITNKRLLKYTGPDSEYQIKHWTGSDITSKHDVMVKRGSLAPTSKAQKRNDIMNAFGSGLLGVATDPNVLVKVLKALEYGDLSEFWQDISLDMGQIKKHIYQIEKGIIPVIYEADNHVLAYQEMNKYRKSDKFEALGPEKQAIFLQIMEEHLQFTMKLQSPNLGMSPDPKDDIEMFNMKLDDYEQSASEVLAQQSAAAQAMPIEEIPE